MEMRVMKLCELNKKLQWEDFHDASLLLLSLQFLDKESFLFNSNIVMEILTSFKDNPEKPIIINCLFKQVKNIEINATMDDKNFSDSSTIYSLAENNGEVELISVRGWKIKFFTSETEVSLYPVLSTN